MEPNELALRGEAAKEHVGTSGLGLSREFTVGAAGYINLAIRSYRDRARAIAPARPELACPDELPFRVVFF